MGVDHKERDRGNRGLISYIRPSFPELVNKKAARSVAASVALISLLGIIFSAYWVLIPLAIGFWLRVGYGPRYSPLALLATKVVAPRLGRESLTPGPPKRFAQAIGAVVTTTAAILVFLFGIEQAGLIALAIMVVFASLESLLDLCVGCRIFNLLMRIGWIPEDICLACADINKR